MSLVSGEDSESDEEINTDQLHERRRGTAMSRAGIVAGEDDEEDEGEGDEETDGGRPDKVAGSVESLDVQKAKVPKQPWSPPSGLHKRLGDTNLSLRRNIVDRILKLYQLTCKNLTVVNDNLSRAQGIVEKVNTNVKKSDQDLEQLGIIMDEVAMATVTFAPTLRMNLSFKQT